jgi:hypothetical protein
MATWETASEADIGGYSSRVILDCFDSQDHDDNCLMNDADNNATPSIYRVVRSASGCSTPFAGKKNTGSNFVKTGSNYIFQLAEAYARVEQLVANNSRDTGAPIYAVGLLIDNTKAVDIVVEAVTNPGAGLGWGIYATENNNLIYGCIVSNCKTIGIFINLGGGETSGAVCCTAADNATGFACAAGGLNYLFSCYAQDNTTEISEVEVWDGGDWNASKGDDTADLGGAATYFDNSQDWSGSLDGDYLAANGSLSADASGAGDHNSGKNPVCPLTSDFSGTWDPDNFFTGPDVLFYKDIAGNARPAADNAAWDVGASEFVGVAGVAPTGGLYGPLVGPMGGPINV